MSDRYDDAVAYLAEHPAKIRSAWRCDCDNPAKILFRFASPSGGVEYRHDGKTVGCLTQIRGSSFCFAWTNELTAAIRADSRLPRSPYGIQVKHLPVFAEWQRKLDSELGREEVARG